MSSSSSSQVVDCPICSKPVREVDINRHIDADCRDLSFSDDSPASTQQQNAPRPSQVATFFQTPAAKRSQNASQGGNTSALRTPAASQKRPVDSARDEDAITPAPKKPKLVNLEKAAPLAERMRPRTLDEVHGQGLVGPNGVLRSLIENDRVPSMILWGGPGTGKTTIARLIAQTAGTRFVEINSTSSGVGECKKLFGEARNELTLTGRKTIIFCDEIHRFSKSQQDVFLAPVEAGTITLIGATTENPSFKVINALLSRCRTFTLNKLGDQDITQILRRALTLEPPASPQAHHLLQSDDYSLLRYLATFSDGDARTALNLLSLALDLSESPAATSDTIKESLTQTLVYDRAGDQHYDTISALHKSVRGSDPDAALYYLARMLQSGEDPVYIARRMVIMASEDIGLADNTMLPLATAAYTAAKEIGMPECRIPLAHCAVALSEAPKSTRSYKGLGAAFAALNEPGVAGLPIPVHLRNAPTRLMKELGYGKEYKYNPDFAGGRVKQEYLPDRLRGRVFLPEGHLGDRVDPEVEEDEIKEANGEVDEGGDERVDDEEEIGKETEGPAEHEHEEAAEDDTNMSVATKGEGEREGEEDEEEEQEDGEGEEGRGREGLEADGEEGVEAHGEEGRGEGEGEDLILNPDGE